MKERNEKDAREEGSKEGRKGTKERTARGKILF